ncbi:MAG: hypothetical protein LBC81_03125 [Tannerellaceae bacterium]|jgi:hypothetical protein|nr:hypothetical protein [Tannerellaceae bacterium]
MGKRAVGFFNKTGTCNPNDHYMRLPNDRLVGAQPKQYIRNKLRRVIHAPRQTGKGDWDKEQGFKQANPLYEELPARYVNSGYNDSLPPLSLWQRQKPDGLLDMDSLLGEFQRFRRRHSDIREQKADYAEAFPHLLLMAFLQRIANGEGYMDRDKFTPAPLSYLLIFNRRPEAKPRLWNERSSRTQDGNITILAL